MEKSALDLALNEAIFSYLLMAAIAMLTAVFIRVLVGVLAATKKKAAEASPPLLVSVTPARDEGAAIAAAIGAAVYAVLGAHRLVYIGEAQRGAGWTGETRARLHTSHTPRGQR